MSIYPTEEELKRIREWDVKEGAGGLISYVESIWHDPGWGFVIRDGFNRFDGKRVRKLELNTGGWSGNEDIICMLRENHHFFWALYWKESICGGHYRFEFPYHKEVKAK